MFQECNNIDSWLSDGQWLKWYVSFHTTLQPMTSIERELEATESLENGLLTLVMQCQLIVLWCGLAGGRYLKAYSETMSQYFCIQMATVAWSYPCSRRGHHMGYLLVWSINVIPYCPCPFLSQLAVRRTFQSKLRERLYIKDFSRVPITKCNTNMLATGHSKIFKFQFLKAITAS